ncbi:hypothetical protein J6590_057221 [Homalodisca vitripennis]|nr:hypothetical protein J6590_057221 [Homalodisca vitripennis]
MHVKPDWYTNRMKSRLKQEYKKDFKRTNEGGKPTEKSTSAFPMVSRLSCQSAFINLRLLTLPSLYILKTVSFCKSKYTLMRSRDVHGYETRERELPIWKIQKQYFMNICSLKEVSILSICCQS